MSVLYLVAHKGMVMQQTTTHQKSIILSRPVADFVPHSPPMILIDQIIDFSDNSLTAQFTVTEQSRFFDPAVQGIASWVGIEYMAQAIAALAGVRASLVNQPVKLGFLLGTRKYQIHQSTLTSNNIYQVTVKELFMDDTGLGAFDCIISHNDEVICQAKLNVFETDDKNQLLKEENE